MDMVLLWMADSVDFMGMVLSQSGMLLQCRILDASNILN